MDLLSVAVGFILGYLMHRIYDYYSPFIVLMGSEVYRGKMQLDSNVEDKIVDLVKEKFQKDHAIRIPKEKLKMKEVRIRPDGLVYSLKILTDKDPDRLAPEKLYQFQEYLNSRIGQIRSQKEEILDQNERDQNS